jgi:membrane protein YdbS with pleckstrin-like domain
MKYGHEKELIEIKTGKILIMKSLITIHGVQHVEVFNNKNRYRADELREY